MRPKAKRPTFADWKKQCQTYADTIGVVAGDDIWDKADSYSIKDEGEEAWAMGEKPEIFVERMFAEDLANMEHDRELARQAMEDNSDEFDDPPEEAFGSHEEPTPVIPSSSKKPN